MLTETEIRWAVKIFRHKDSKSLLGRIRTELEAEERAVST